MSSYLMCVYALSDFRRLCLGCVSECRRSWKTSAVENWSSVLKQLQYLVFSFKKPIFWESFLTFINKQATVTAIHMHEYLVGCKVKQPFEHLSPLLLLHSLHHLHLENLLQGLSENGKIAASCLSDTDTMHSENFLFAWTPFSTVRKADVFTEREREVILIDWWQTLIKQMRDFYCV